ncbi:MAG: substrate-binding domain-containing protein [Candidatus Methanodesulfokora sp.]|jgi:molybdate-binding protein|nr:MAG: hypothetical protein C0200_01925 [Candidatus Korarchaeota archaeon]
MGNPHVEIRPEIEVSLVVNGRKLDEELAKALDLMDLKGSLYEAARTMGSSYFRLLKRISELEEAAGRRIVERRGRSLVLTDFGRMLLSMHKEESRRAKGWSFERRGGYDASIAASHCMGVEVMASMLRRKYSINVRFVGSSGGLALLMLDEADIAGIHLRGRIEDHLSRYWLEDRVKIYRGYIREIGFVSRDFSDIDSLKEAIIKGNIRMINRNIGSGTRLLLDDFLKGVVKDPSKLRGYNMEVRSHLEVVKAISSGKADFGLAVRYFADLYGLKFIKIADENYDFVIKKESIKKPAVSSFIDILRSEKFSNAIKKIKGYKIPEDIGREIY